MPNFTRKAVYNLWGQADRASWERDKDQLQSAKILLEEGRKAGGLGMYEIRPIEIEVEDGFEAIVWSLPDMLRQWGGRIREISLDSACLYNTILI
jgi:hypothetical protein